MHEWDDSDLLREYVEHESEAAFAALVTRHVNQVYSVALRRTGNPHAAEEITQAVFVILARKSRFLGPRVLLSGWLYQTARLTAVTFVRGEIRRAHREQEAHMQTILNEPADEAWPHIAPLLETAMAGLNETDRHAVVLRYFDGKSLKEVGAALGANEDAAKKRVQRAVDKLRRFFTKRGLLLPGAVLTAALSAHAVQAAPPALAQAVTAVAFAKGATAGGSTLTLIKGALKLMAWTKAKTAIVIGAGMLLAAGTTTVTVKEIQGHQTYPWQIGEGVIVGLQLHQPPQVRILPSKFHRSANYIGPTMVGTGLTAKDVVAAAYGYPASSRAVLSVGLPARRYDYIASLPGGVTVNEKALQAEVRRIFGVVATIETRETDVWLLKVKSPAAPGLKPNNSGQDGNGFGPVAGGFRGWNETLLGLAWGLEDEANVPVLDATGLTNHFDFDLNCQQADLANHNWYKVNQALDPLGLELVPGRRTLTVLVVEKAK
jgi:uncharacterized protein (TIGR03435 family)